MPAHAESSKPQSTVPGGATRQGAGTGGDASSLLARLSYHLENSPVIVTEWDKDFVLKYWSQQAEEVFGWRAEEVLGKGPWEFGFVPPEDREKVADVNYRMVSAAESRSVSFNRNYDKQGNIHYCEWYNSALLDEKGELASIFSITLDVTDRVRAEQQLRAREQFLSLAYNAAQLWFWEIDVRTGELCYPDAGERSYAPPYAQATLTLDEWIQRLHPDDHQRVRDAIRRALIEGGDYDNQFRIDWSDGTYHWVYNRGSVIRDATGHPLRMVGVGMDITARKHAEEELRESRERMRLAAEAARLCAWDYDLHQGRIRWSGDFEAIYGHAEPDAGCLEDLLLLVHPDDQERLQRQLRSELASTEPTHRMEFRVCWADGSVHWLLAFGRYIFDSEGRARHLLGVTMDITDRKRSEEALRVNDRLIATGRMAASLAHEINNPLTSVTNLLYLLGLQPLDEVSRGYLQMASSEAARVANITRNILGLYRESPTAVDLDLCELLDNVLVLFRNMFESKGLRVIARYRERGMVHGYPGELRQLFANLVGNALDAMPERGILTVHVSRCGGRLRVTLADTGGGIAPEYLAKVWEPFFTTKGEKGTGLGLWISRQIVNKHGGEIRVRSRTTPGQSGTAFCVLLPLLEPAVNGPRKAMAG